MNRAEWLPGDRAYLVPTLPTAPSAAYHCPQVTLVTIPRNLAERVEIRLPTGTTLWTNVANLRRRIPSPPPDPRPKPAPKPHPDQPTLW